MTESTATGLPEEISFRKIITGSGLLSLPSIEKLFGSFFLVLQATEVMSAKTNKKLYFITYYFDTAKIVIKI
jgi:hypothetical protein